MTATTAFDTGTIYGADFETPPERIEYVPHRTFRGVSLKHLVTGEATGGRLSCHLVKVEPHGILGLHHHPEQVEIHEVVAGDGECLLGGTLCAYRPGTIGVVPPGTEHEVKAGKDGLFILATFTPALL